MWVGFGSSKCDQEPKWEDYSAERFVDAFKTDILADKAKIIRLQDELLENKDDQIENLESSVEKTVHNTVERGIKSYSEAVSKLGFEGPIVTSEKLKLAVKVRLRRRIEAEP